LTAHAEFSACTAQTLVPDCLSSVCSWGCNDSCSATALPALSATRTCTELPVQAPLSLSLSLCMDGTDRPDNSFCMCCTYCAASLHDNNQCGGVMCCPAAVVQSSELLLLLSCGLRLNVWPGHPTVAESLLHSNCRQCVP
jgi:hypothetical protein